LEFIMKKILSAVLATAVSALIAAPTTAAASTYTQTKHPIVLVHGWLGWDSIAGIDHFYRVAAELRANGAQVYTAAVSQNNSTEYRGEQLLSQVKRILATTGAQKVNLIGHSHGSPTSRYVAGVRPDLVASVTSVGGVNKGVLVPDILSGTVPVDSVTFKALTGAVNGLGKAIAVLSGNPDLEQNSAETLKSLSTAGANAFNARFPQGIPTTACGEGAYTATTSYNNVNYRVNYYSWSGAKAVTNLLDISDPFFAVTTLVYKGAKNDGLVGSCQSRLGRVIRDDYAMNHLDEVNQFVGLVHLFETNPVTIYRQHANRLKAAGF
jgi:triacylglycerol lipase